MIDITTLTLADLPGLTDAELANVVEQTAYNITLIANKPHITPDQYGLLRRYRGLKTSARVELSCRSIGQTAAELPTINFLTGQIMDRRAALTAATGEEG